MITIAIDPGINGAIAWHDSVGGTILVEKMPVTIMDKVTLLEKFFPHCMTCVIEDVGTHMQGNSAMASARFARHCGELWGIIVALGIPVRSVKPLKWQKCIPNMPQRPKTTGLEPAVKRRALAEHKKKCKDRIKDEMQCRYPHLKITLVNADALGILTWALNDA